MQHEAEKLIIEVRIKRVFTSVLTAALLLNPAAVWASENEMMDALIHKLVQKGVLSREDASEIRKEVAEEAVRMSKERAEETKDTAKKMRGGSWLDKVKWGGDLRLRHENQDRNPAVDRTRERFRLRFGFKANPVDPIEIGVRLATGTAGDPVSTNQSFSASFDKKALFVDQAYAKYTPWKDQGLSITGGKMENPFMTIPEGIVWDSDVTPEGAALQWVSPSELPILPIPVKPFANVGAFQLSELSADAGDPGLFGFQGGAEFGLPALWNATFQSGVAYYDFTAVKGSNITNVTQAGTSPNGNSTITQGAARKYSKDYNVLSWTSKLTIPELFFGQPVSVLGDYTYNNDDIVGLNDDNVDDDGGYTVGAEIGKVTDDFGSWKAFYFRKRIEPDAALGALSDSDFGGGGTNHKGHLMGLQIGLNKYASVGIKYLRTDEIEGTQNRFDTFQADLQLKY